jgi:hypothetical protein
MHARRSEVWGRGRQTDRQTDEKGVYTITSSTITSQHETLQSRLSSSWLGFRKLNADCLRNSVDDFLNSGLRRCKSLLINFNASYKCTHGMLQNYPADILQIPLLISLIMF